MPRKKKEEVAEYTMNTQNAATIEREVWPEAVSEPVQILSYSYYVQVEITFVRELLGLTPNNPEMYKEYLAMKAKKATARLRTPETIKAIEQEFFRNVDGEMEAMTVDENCIDLVDKGTLIFPKNKDGLPCIWDYQWKGFLKERIEAGVNRGDEIHIPGLGIQKLGDIKNWIMSSRNDLVVVDELSPIILPDGKQITIDQHPIRFKDQNNSQIKVSAIASCETIPRGSKTIVTFKAKRKGWFPVIKYCLEEGFDIGTGSRRTDKFGTFTFREVRGSLNCCTTDDWRKMIPKTKGGI